MKARAKLTADDVDVIRRSREPGPVLARRFGVSTATISRIRSWKAWTS